MDSDKGKPGTNRKESGCSLESVAWFLRGWAMWVRFSEELSICQEDKRWEIHPQRFKDVNWRVSYPGNIDIQENCVMNIERRRMWDYRSEQNIEGFFGQNGVPLCTSFVTVSIAKTNESPVSSSPSKQEEQQNCRCQQKEVKDSEDRVCPLWWSILVQHLLSSFFLIIKSPELQLVMELSAEWPCFMVLSSELNNSKQCLMSSLAGVIS